jgi:t-SNARE complex subunit (syntaxin)
MKGEFDHAANDSPRSGSSKRVTPMVWGVIVVAIVIIVVIWFAVGR